MKTTGSIIFIAGRRRANLDEIARPTRNNVGPNESAFVTQFNDRFKSRFVVR